MDLAPIGFKLFTYCMYLLNGFGINEPQNCGEEGGVLDAWQKPPDYIMLSLEFILLLVYD